MEIVATKNNITPIFSVFLFIILAFASCNDTTENEVDNLSPSTFEITVNSTTNDSASISWEKSLDPEGSIVFYDIYLNSIKIIDNITELSYSFENLSENQSYSGEIIASDPEGNIVSVPFLFETTENQPPSLFSITVTNTDPFYSRIEWTESIDPEGGEINYQVYVDDVLLFEGLNSLNYIFPELKGLQNYAGRIEAIDIGGKKTKVEYSFTTTIKIYDDDLLLSNQSLVESFGNKGYNQVDGNLNIGSLQSNLTDVNDLSLLKSINSVNGNLSIRNTICTSFNGLQNMDIIHQYSKLTIENNDELLNCNGLNNISKVHEINIVDNHALLNLDGFTSLSTVTNYLWIVFNPALNSIAGIQNLNNVNTFDIGNNDSLLTLIGLENITTVGEFTITNNDSLENLNGLDNLTSCSSLNISDNYKLQNLNNLSNLNYSGSLYITDNPLLINLSGLENLTNINHTLTIARNQGLLTLKGIENIVFSNNSANYHSLTIWENINITNLTPLSNFSFNRGKINIDFNSKLTDLCGLTKIISEINNFINDNNFASNNAYNPSEKDILNGNCSI
jgi:hypothetical protein